MVVQSRIKAVLPDISADALQKAVAFAVDAMQQTRDAYHEPVALAEVRVMTDRSLLFTIKTLYTHNTSSHHMVCYTDTDTAGGER